MSELVPVRSTGLGSWPGTDVADAIKIAFAECPELPYLPELPARGAHAGMVGRATALLAGMAVDLQPAGWRLTDGSGRDHRLARATLRADLDQLEELAQGYAGPLKVSVCGPWTLAATMERPRGDRVLADHGARREVAQSLAEGVGELLAELGGRLPDVRFLLQVDEPALPAVLAGAVPTASGFSRHRVVDVPEVSTVLTELAERVGPTPVGVHCCADDPPVGLLHRAGLRAVSVDLGRLRTQALDEVGAAMTEGLWLGAGVLRVPTRPNEEVPGPDELARRVLKPLRQLGLEPEVACRTVLTPTCGLAGATREQAVAALRALRRAAGIVTDQLAD